MFKVLALDGGGIKGTYTAAVLDELQRKLPKNRTIVDYFDLIVGTSTGGIIALGLANELSTSQVLSIYKEDGPKIFPDARLGPIGILEWIFGAKHDPENLKQSLKGNFAKRKLGQSLENVAITSFDTINAKPIVFRSNYKGEVSRFSDSEISEIGLATSAAPTYFPAAENSDGLKMIDGGIWANCPAMVGVTEAVNKFEQENNEISVLSIGTTLETQFIENNLLSGGKLDWASAIAPVMLHASKKAALRHASDLSKYVHRIDREVEPGRFNLDDASAINDLEHLGRSSADEHWKVCKSKFFHRLAKHRPQTTSSKKKENSDDAALEKQI